MIKKMEKTEQNNNYLLFKMDFFFVSLEPSGHSFLYDFIHTVASISYFTILPI